MAVVARPGHLLVEALDHEDDWSGIADSDIRRKIQNRLNQRARRRRKSPRKWTPLRSRIDDIIIGHQEVPPLTLLYGRHELPAGIRLSAMELIALFLARGYFPLSSDHLIPLIQFNVYRAILTNMFTLRNAHLFDCEEGVPEVARLSVIPPPATVPPSLQPTALQCLIPHPPYVDLFPLAGLRDALVRACGSYDDGELCFDLLGSISGGHFERSKECDRKGLVIWGEPWRVDSWEVEEGFVKKWGWMLNKDCEDLLRATNRWREVRGDEPLQWSDWGIDVLEC